MREGMIFAAGIGSRLKPFTDQHPKALAPIGPQGKTALDYALAAMANAKVKHVVVNIHHFPEQIISHLKNHTPKGMEVEVSDETEELLETGGGLRKALDMFDGESEILIHNADIVSNLDIERFCREIEKEAYTDGQLLVKGRKSSRQLLFDSDFLLRGWENIKDGLYKGAGIDKESAERLRPMAFGGIHIIKPRVTEALRDYSPIGKRFSIIDFYLDNCHRLNLKGYEIEATALWHDIGTTAKLEAAVEDFKKK